MATTLAQYKQEAVTFYWRWLIGASLVSIVGNMAHALFSDNPTAIPWVAATMSIVPPVFAGLATHGMSLLVRTQIVGWYFKVTLIVMGVLAFGSLVLSFVSLVQLASTQGGMSIWVAWIWPLVVDLAVAFSTIALLALTVGTRSRRTTAVRTPAKKRAPKKVVKPKLVPMEVGA
ncbi:membrane protein [Mycobacterium phage MrMagoo]|uniref:Membrane protein n=1 Tax=Mycobacterium phage MrMagoo TaxID=1927020 RepID=A0A1L6BYR0_9CAUD|nr:membrane protein [Mycobacterium phage MrMagoo]APQ42234.1 membrane protein [Mycobacterium phage MrMagoo]ARM70303.1 membrane protein [Mycobacterium phage GardenSalsa]